ncbi:MAG: hypothetical protein WCX86_07570 [Candidatus Hydrogenedentales bacterium]
MLGILYWITSDTIVCFGKNSYAAQRIFSFFNTILGGTMKISKTNHRAPSTTLYIYPLLICTCILTAFIAVGLPAAKDHTLLTLKVMGIDENYTNASLNRFLNDFSSTIDNAEELQADRLKNKIRQKAPELAAKLPDDFSSVKHRYFFHWGYNAGGPYDNSAKPLRNQFEEKFVALKKKAGFTEEEIKTLRKVLYDIFAYEWNQIRKPKLKQTTRSAFGLPSDKTTALATIVYEIHILADFTTEDRDALSELKFHVRKELIDNGLKKLFRGTHESANAEKTISKIEDSIAIPMNNETIDLKSLFEKEDPAFKNLFPMARTNITRLSRDQRQALTVLLILKQDLPLLLQGAFSTHLNSKGIPMVSQKG